jgi:hypothetical protein
MDVVELPVVWRAAVAARNFEVGEEILREPPLLLLPKIRQDTPLFDSLDAIANKHHVAEKVLYPCIYYCRASEEIKSKVKEFYVPRLDEDGLQYKRYHGAVTEVAELPELKASGVPWEELLDFILILRCNVHMIGDGTKTSALFYLGSKVTHSCDPNCMALAIGIQLVYRAIRPIVKGEPITFSYISGFDLWKSTPARRELLLDQRFFTCCCLRCTREDRCRYRICPECGDQNLCRYESGQLSYMGQDPTPPTDTPWFCQNAECGKKFKDEDMDLEVEKALQYNVLENFFSTKQITSVHPELPQTMLKVCEEKLGRNHWLTLLMIYSHMAMHHTALNSGQKPLSTGKDCLVWADRLCKWMEVAMPNTMQQAVIAKFAGQTAEVYGVPELASLWFTRAIPVLRVHHGNHGKDIREMLAYIEEHGSPEQIVVASKPCRVIDMGKNVPVVSVKNSPTTNGKPSNDEGKITEAPEAGPVDPAVTKKQAKREKIKEQRKLRKGGRA